MNFDLTFEINFREHTPMEIPNGLLFRNGLEGEEIGTVHILKRDESTALVGVKFSDNYRKFAEIQQRGRLLEWLSKAYGFVFEPDNGQYFMKYFYVTHEPSGYYDR